MSYRAGSTYSEHQDYWTGSEVELSYISPAVSKGFDNDNQHPHIYTDTQTLLGDADTSYTSVYRNTVGNTAFKKRPTSWSWTKPWKYVKLGSGGGNNEAAQRSPHRGWRKAVILSAIVAGLVFAINTGFTMFAMIKFGAEDGVGTLLRTNCDVVKRWNTALHLLINILGTALLSASSYTMQCLNSPTRSEVDVAHAKRVSLDIGLPSLRNFFHMKWWRTVLWLGLCLSTLPLHLFWNSTILTTSGSNLLSYVVADETFLTGAKYQEPNSTTTKAYSSYGYCTEYRSAGVDLSKFMSSVYSGYKAGNYTTLTATQCFNAYVDGDGSDRRNLIIITKPTTAMNMSYCGYRSQRWNGSSVLAVDFDLSLSLKWVISTNNVGPSRYGISNYTYSPSTASQEAAEKTIRQQVSGGSWYFGPYPVSRCLSETQGVSRCQLQFVSYLLYVVIACNFIKVVCMVVTARSLWDLDEPILATVGDATASFLEKRDETTAGWCLIDFTKLNEMQWWKSGNPQIYDPVYKRKTVRRLMSATSMGRWWWTMTICTLYLIAGFVLWDLSFGLGTGDMASQAAQMKAQFGEVNESMLMGLSGTSAKGLLTDIIVANSFQLALSTTYFLYNSLYTAQCAAIEWASYARGKLRPLRVTWPRGSQRSTYYLHLPYRYGLPLTILLIVMHFLISQSIFLARMQFYNMDDQVEEDLGYMDIGYSPPATLTACCVGAAMIIAQIINACRGLDNTIPTHGNKSAVISAMCHPGSGKRRSSTVKSHANVRDDDDGGIASKAVMWGVIDEPGVDPTMAGFQGQPPHPPGGHCGFSDSFVEPPKNGSPYF